MHFELAAALSTCLFFVELSIIAEDHDLHGAQHESLTDHMASSLLPLIICRSKSQVDQDDLAADVLQSCLLRVLKGRFEQSSRDKSDIARMPSD